MAYRTPRQAFFDLLGGAIADVPNQVRGVRDVEERRRNEYNRGLFSLAELKAQQEQQGIENEYRQRQYDLSVQQEQRYQQGQEFAQKQKLLDAQNGDIQLDRDYKKNRNAIAAIELANRKAGLKADGSPIKDGAGGLTNSQLQRAQASSDRKMAEKRELVNKPGNFVPSDILGANTELWGTDDVTDPRVDSTLKANRAAAEYWNSPAANDSSAIDNADQVYRMDEALKNRGVGQSDELSPEEVAQFNEMYKWLQQMKAGKK